MIVLDSSAVLSVLLDEQEGDEVERIMGAHPLLCAPALLAYELVNILSLRGRRAGTDTDAADALAQFTEWPWAFESQCTLTSLQAVSRLCSAHRLTAYDASYLELAQQRACALVTFDATLRKAARAEGVSVLP